MTLLPLSLIWSLSVLTHFFHQTPNYPLSMREADGFLGWKPNGPGRCQGQRRISLEEQAAMLNEKGPFQDQHLVCHEATSDGRVGASRPSGRELLPVPEGQKGGSQSSDREPPFGSKGYRDAETRPRHRDHAKGPRGDRRRRGQKSRRESPSPGTKGPSAVSTRTTNDRRAGQEASPNTSAVPGSVSSSLVRAHPSGRAAQGQGGGGQDGRRGVARTATPKSSAGGPAGTPMKGGKRCHSRQRPSPFQGRPKTEPAPVLAAARPGHGVKGGSETKPDATSADGEGARATWARVAAGGAQLSRKGVPLQPEPQ